MQNLLRWNACVVAVLLTSQAGAFAQDDLKVTDKIQTDDPADPVRQKPGKVHLVKLSAGKKYQIDLVSKDFDAYLRLENSAGQEVAKDDDGGDGLNARIKYVTDKDDTFKIYVTTFAGGLGDYTLTVLAAGAVPAVAGKGTDINVNGEIQGTDPGDPVRRNPGRVHVVKLNKGVAYQIDMMSKELDAYLRLEDSTGKELAKDDDGGEGLNSRIRFTPDKDDSYKLFATTFSGGTGKYVLTVKGGDPAGGNAGEAIKLAAPVAGTPTQHQGQIAGNDPIDPIRRRNAKVHVVEFKAGKTYVIDLSSTDFDSYLRLESGTGNQLAMDDDSGGNLNARITFAAQADGQYRVIATTFSGGQGAYNLRIAEQ